MGKSFRHWLQNGYTDRLAHTLVAPHLSTHTILSSQLSLELPLSLLSPQLSLELPLFISPLPSAPPLLLRARRDNRKEAAAVSIGPAWHGRSQRWSSSSLPCSVCAAPSALRVPPPMLIVLLDLTLPQAHGGRHSGGASMWTRGGARWPRWGHVVGREG